MWSDQVPQDRKHSCHIVLKFDRIGVIHWAILDSEPVNTGKTEVAILLLTGLAIGTHVRAFDQFSDSQDPSGLAQPQINAGVNLHAYAVVIRAGRSGAHITSDSRSCRAPPIEQSERIWIGLDT